MILYFSGTGNSKYIASELSAKLGMPLFSINDALKYGAKPELDKDENLVIVCPTYAWRIPKVVERFILTNDLGAVKRIWFVMTCGGEIADAAKYNEHIAADKNLEYMGSFGIKLPDNYIIMFKAPSHKSADALFAAAPAKIETAAGCIAAVSAFPKPRRNLYDRAMSKYVNPGFYKSVSSKEFEVSDACIGCGLCEKLCPLNNIKMVDGKPVWGSTTCTHCMACISYCSRGCIEFGKKTVGKRRYTIEGYMK